MLFGTVSHLGSYHAVNQDCGMAGAFRDGFFILVSDGLGSKAQSQIGSRAACHTMKRMIEGHLDMETLSSESFIEQFHQNWTEEVGYSNVHACGATFLGCIVTDDRIFAFRLGDGFLNLTLTDCDVTLFDRKEDRFENETECLSERFFSKQWEMVEMKNTGFIGAIACTDGIDVDDYTGFAQDFCYNYRNENIKFILTDIERWLPGCEGADDKTIAFLLYDGEVG